MIIKESTKLTESRGTFKLIPTQKVKNLPNKILAELEYYPKDESFSIPWDADISIQNGFLVLNGSVATNNYGQGTSITKIPLKNVDKLVELTYFGELSDSEINSLTSDGWIIK